MVLINRFFSKKLNAENHKLRILSFSNTDIEQIFMDVVTGKMHVLIKHINEDKITNNNTFKFSSHIINAEDENKNVSRDDE